MRTSVFEDDYVNILISELEKSQAGLPGLLAREKEIEEEICNTQKNKATEHHIGKLKAKLAKLRAQLELHKAKSSGGGKGYYIKKAGDATVALVGWPSVGKSSLLNYLTESKS